MASQPQGRASNNEENQEPKSHVTTTSCEHDGHVEVLDLDTRTRLAEQSKGTDICRTHGYISTEYTPELSPGMVDYVAELEAMFDAEAAAEDKALAEAVAPEDKDNEAKSREEEEPVPRSSSSGLIQIDEDVYEESSLASGIDILRLLKSFIQWQRASTLLSEELVAKKIADQGYEDEKFDDLDDWTMDDSDKGMEVALLLGMAISRLAKGKPCKATERYLRLVNLLRDSRALDTRKNVARAKWTKLRHRQAMDHGFFGQYDTSATRITTAATRRNERILGLKRIMDGFLAWDMLKFSGDEVWMLEPDQGPAVIR